MMRDATEKLPAIEDRKYGISSTGKKIRGWSTPMKRRPIFMGSPSPFQGGGFQGRADAEVMMRDATEKLPAIEDRKYGISSTGKKIRGWSTPMKRRPIFMGSPSRFQGRADAEVMMRDATEKLQDEDESGEYERDESGEYGSGENDGEDKDESGEDDGEDESGEYERDESGEDESGEDDTKEDEDFETGSG